jgi:hypothetical protein
MFGVTPAPRAFFTRDSNQDAAVGFLKRPKSWTMRHGIERRVDFVVPALCSMIRRRSGSFEKPTYTGSRSFVRIYT